MTRAAAAGEATTLSRELSEFLIELSIGLHKNAIYPPGHPLLENTSAELQRRLDTLLKERQALSLGVARHQLIIEGVATEDTNPVLRELAMRLHRHHLGAVKFSQGVAEAELVDMLATVSVDAGRAVTKLGEVGVAQDTGIVGCDQPGPAVADDVAELLRHLLDRGRFLVERAGAVQHVMGVDRLDLGDVGLGGGSDLHAGILWRAAGIVVCRP